MTANVLQDVKIFVNQYDLSGNHNQLSLNYVSEIKDATTFESTYKKKVVGLKSISLLAQGYFDASSIGRSDPVYWGNLSTQDTGITICPNGSTSGDSCIMFRGLKGEYSPFKDGQVGKLLPFDISFSGHSGGSSDLSVMNGKILLSPQTPQSTHLTLGDPIYIGDLRKSAYSTEALGAIVHVINISASGGGSPSGRIRFLFANSSEGAYASYLTIGYKSNAGVTFKYKQAAGLADSRVWVKTEFQVTSSSHSFDIQAGLGFA